MRRVAFYAHSLLGGGHLSRALALYNALRRQGFRGELRAFSPEATPLPLPFPLQVTPLSDAETLHPVLARNSAAARALAAYRPDLLIVDTFWAPLAHILPMLREVEAWLLLRWVPPAWLAAPGRPEPRRLFRRILRIEPFPGLSDLPVIAPVVVCNPDEQHPPQALKERLGIDPGRRLTLILHGGVQGEAEALRRDLSLPAEEVIHTLTLRDPAPLFPAAPWLLGADRLVGGTGYNFYWETAWLGLRERTLYRPFRRGGEDTAWRLQACANIQPGYNGADWLARAALAG